mgnify:CR=1 FL=1
MRSPPRRLVADLVVTKSDGVTELLPGSATVYTITVTNQGPDAVTGATLTDTAPAGLTLGNWTCVATRRLLVRERRRRQSLDRHQPAAWRNRDIHRAGSHGRRCAGVSRQHGSRDGPGGSDRSGAGEQHRDRPERDGAAAERGRRNPRRCARRWWVRRRSTCRSTVDVTNTGQNPLTNLQVADSLSSAFAQGSPTITISGAPGANGQVADSRSSVRRRRAAVSGPCVANSGFTGIGAEFGPGNAAAQRVRDRLASDRDARSISGCVSPTPTPRRFRRRRKTTA